MSVSLIGHGLRVILVGNFISAHRGTRFYCEDLAARLASAGCEVLTTSSRRTRIGRLLGMLLAVLFWRKRYDVAVVDVYSGRAFYLAALASVALAVMRKRQILVLHGGNLPAFHARRGLCVLRVLKLGSLVVSPSSQICTYFRAQGIVVDHMPNGLDVAAYQFSARSHPAMKLLWLRAFDDVYAPLLAVKVVELLRRRYPGAVLSMAGPVRSKFLFRSVQAYVAKSGLQSAVKFVGSVQKSDVPQLFATHEIFINTTRAESFGVSVVEAAASGLPIVSTCVGEIPHIWNHRESAMLVHCDDAEAMASAVSELVHTPGLAEYLSCNARRKAFEYDWNVILPRWIELLRLPTVGSRLVSGGKNS